MIKKYRNLFKTVLIRHVPVTSLMFLEPSSFKTGGKKCDSDVYCQRKFANPHMECRGGVCLEKGCSNNSVCPMDSLCIKGNCIDVAQVIFRRVLIILNLLVII